MVTSGGWPGDSQGRLRRLGRLDDIPIPNPAIADFLLSARLRSEVERVTATILAAYVNSLPMSEPDPNVPGAGKMNLRRHAGSRVEIVDTEMGPRWVGWVTNDAESYRPPKAPDRAPYARFIEYGKPSKGIPGGYHLRRAAELVASSQMLNAASTAYGGDIPSAPRMPPGISYEPRGRGSQFRGARGRFVKAPIFRDGRGRIVPNPYKRATTSGRAKRKKPRKN